VHWNQIFYFIGTAKPYYQNDLVLQNNTDLIDVFAKDGDFLPLNMELECLYLYSLSDKNDKSDYFSVIKVSDILDFRAENSNLV
jgi:hypothetical protein